MSSTLTRALVFAVPVAVLLCWSIRVFATTRRFWSLLQLLGAGCLLVVVLAHVCEALHFLPGMNWGLRNSVGHYLDLCSAVLGLALFPIAHLLRALSSRTT